MTPVAIILGGPFLALAVLGLLIVVQRLVYLSLVQRRVRCQLGDPESLCDDNPLGRVLAAGKALHADDIETLEMQLDEAILRELPPLTRGQSLVKLLAAVAPLLGLLGTVTGMIVTFQSISLFGTGDPKLMASGISQALVTTGLGLSVSHGTVEAHRGAIEVESEVGKGTEFRIYLAIDKLENGNQA